MHDPFDITRHDEKAVACVSGGRSWTWGALYQQAVTAATALAERGVGAGTRVAVLAGPSIEFVALVHALRLLRAVLIPLNTRLGSAELSSLLQRLDPHLLVHDSTHTAAAHTASTHPEDAALPRNVALVTLDALMQDGTRGGALPRLRAPDPADLATILCTSGTSGRPKLVPHTWEKHAASAAASSTWLGSGPADHWLCVLPLFHAGGLAMLFRAAFDGAAVTLHPRFDARGVSRALRDGGITIASLVPTMLADVLAADPPPPSAGALTAETAPRLRAVLLGGGPASPALFDDIIRRGLPVLGTYGLTETASQAVTVPLDRARDARCAGSAGLPLPGVELLVADDDGRPVPQGRSGRILLRAPMLTDGWLDDPGAWAQRMHDGRFDTGDLGRIDAEGMLRVDMRREDLIVSGGENIDPAEIERVLETHPAVAAAAVVGLPDARWGQRVAAAVVPRTSGDALTQERTAVDSVSTHSLSPDAVLTDTLEAWCRAELAGFKRPRTWRIVNALPRTASGKLSRAAVRLLFAEDDRTGEGGGEEPGTRDPDDGAPDGGAPDGGVPDGVDADGQVTVPT